MVILKSIYYIIINSISDHIGYLSFSIVISVVFINVLPYYTKGFTLRIGEYSSSMVYYYNNL